MAGFLKDYRDQAGLVKRAFGVTLATGAAVGAGVFAMDYGEEVYSDFVNGEVDWDTTSSAFLSFYSGIVGLLVGAGGTSFFFIKKFRVFPKKCSKKCICKWSFSIRRDY